MIRSFCHFQWCKLTILQTKNTLQKLLGMLLSFYLVLIWRLPFNWRTPLGYLIALLLQGTLIFGMTYTDIPVFCFLFQSCQLLDAFAQDISKDVLLLDVQKNSEFAGIYQSQVTENFIELAQNFALIKELSMHGVSVLSHEKLQIFSF